MARPLAGILKTLATGLENIEAKQGHGDPSLAANRNERLHALDGLRGWAALVVVVFHIFYEVFGIVCPMFRNPVTHALSGQLAIFLFFVLSGEALSAPYFAGGGVRTVASLAAKRHSRLALPIFATTALVVVLQHLDLIRSAEAAHIVQRDAWLGNFATQPISTVDIVKYSFLRVFTTTNPDLHLIPFLWTMCAEMLGSIFVFALLGCWGWLRHRQLLMICSTTLMLGNSSTAFLACFGAGLLFGSLRQLGFFRYMQSSKFGQSAAWLAIGVPLIIVAQIWAVDDRLFAAAAMLLVCGVHCSPVATRFFSSGLSRLLGKLSFPLYLMQFPVIVAFTSGLVVHFANGLDAMTAAWIGLASLIVTLIAAACFEPVELLTKIVGHRISAIFVRPASITP